MNKVMQSQAEVINYLIMNNQALEAREFMSEMHMPFDQQDRILSAIGRLSKPSARKVGIILELSSDRPLSDALLK
jgi:hypothetical protein